MGFEPRSVCMMQVVCAYRFVVIVGTCAMRVLWHITPVCMTLLITSLPKLNGVSSNWYSGRSWVRFPLGLGIFSKKILTLFCLFIFLVNQILS